MRANMHVVASKLGEKRSLVSGCIRGKTKDETCRSEPGGALGVVFDTSFADGVGLLE